MALELGGIDLNYWKCVNQVWEIYGTCIVIGHTETADIWLVE